tara:strand:- start:193 stop:339 length:147 start_codon:yes stop_codon:yes gene_type:complete
MRFGTVEQTGEVEQRMADHAVSPVEHDKLEPRAAPVAGMVVAVNQGYR